jgi:hypothetical protein
MIKAFVELDPDTHPNLTVQELLTVKQGVEEFLADPERCALVLPPGMTVTIFDLPEGADTPVSVEVRPGSVLEGGHG